MDTTERKSLTCADTARLMRKELKTVFPSVRFSVRSSVYANGASITVSWIDGPFVEQVEKVCKRYEGASFDGTIDLKEYKPDTLMAFEGEDMPVLVSFGSDFVFCNRELSPAYIAQLSIEAQKVLDMNTATAGKVFAYDERMTDGDYLATDYGTITHPYAYGANIVRFLSNHIAPKVGA